MKIDELRASFERWMSSTLYEHMFDRYGPESKLSGEYKVYETQLSWEGWLSATQRCIDIIERYQVPIGNSAAGEMACELTMNALRQIRDEIVNGDSND